MKLEEVIDKRLHAYNSLCDTVIMVIYFDEDNKDRIITNLARKATSESEELDIFNYENKKYTWVWYEAISLEEWYNKESHITYPQNEWKIFH